MCEPVTMMTVMAVAQTGMSIQAQKQSAKIQKQQQAQATKRLNQQHLLEMRKVRAQEAQDNIIASKEIEQATKRAMKAKATARVSAGEAGVTGLSVQALLDDYTKQEAEFRFGLQQQRRFNKVARDLGMETAELAYQNNYSSINQPIEQVNYLAEGLNLAGNLMTIKSQADSNQLQKDLLSETKTYNNKMLELETDRLAFEKLKYGGGK